MSIERADSEADRKAVILISQLLKPVGAVTPEHAEFDFGALTGDDPVRLTIGGPHHIEAPSRQESCDQLFPDGPFLP